MVTFEDRTSIGTVKRTSEGYISAVARTVRTGVQEYGAWENEGWGALADAIGKPRNAMLKVYRPPESVFSKDSLRSAVHIPVTVGHPEQLVDSGNWAEHAVGETGSDIIRDGEMVAFSLMVKDKRGTDEIDAGNVELSAGYEAELFVDSTDSEYDYIMGPPKYNHIALVPSGRAGSKARIGDAKWGAMPINLNDRKDSKLDMVKLMVGDKAVQVAASDADVVTGLVKDHAAAINAKDTAIGELTAKLADAEAKVLTDAQIADMVAAKVEADKKLEAVRAKFGDEAVKDATPAMIDGMFRVIDKAVAVDDSARAVFGDKKVAVGDADVEARTLAAQRKFLNLEQK